MDGVSLSNARQAATLAAHKLCLSTNGEKAGRDSKELGEVFVPERWKWKDTKGEGYTPYFSGSTIACNVGLAVLEPSMIGEPADPFATPLEILPEWYFFPKVFLTVIQKPLYHENQKRNQSIVARSQANIPAPILPSLKDPSTKIRRLAVGRFCKFREGEAETVCTVSPFSEL
ncbi:hypothetical protein G4B88_016662 [Cannabis sativa]|uniref:Cytochrome b/b6 C-terminal region profile domain-containing protein n=1 Tax=Cannabis sativa TaxID=3483 RepID=A0A7J6H7T8_CANSA|nr:hypothetical protein G4B88_016662 [Cannabis sativa]